ncbi:ras and Rab interactor 3 [Elephas maximus indicus]|uniref:ras and Rab interactor 3 n=1 Tax=Elephas maximus indicus TaxID=99487 RepID=UPI002116B3CF|nr:ras and Rab interactor 3 [Elephas maximus indicus]
MIRRAGAPVRGDPTGPISDVGKEEGKEEKEEDGVGLCLPATPKNCLPRRGISVLEKLIRTCPVWLQLGLGRAEVAGILQQEAAGTFLVRKDGSLKHLVLCVHVPSRNEGSSEVLEYTIREERSILYLEGSVLVFEDIFKLIAFYCVSRDLLPFTLRLPQAILEARSFTDLETISNLGLGFWNSALNPRRAAGSPSEPPRDLAPRGVPPASSLRPTAHYSNCSCEIELAVGNDCLWFVNPVFIEDCSGAQSTDPPSLGSCPVRLLPLTSNATSPTSRWAPRRPPPPPPVPPANPPLRPPPLSPPPPPTPALPCPSPRSDPVAAAPHSPEPLVLTPPVSATHLAPHAPGPPDLPSHTPMTACERLPHPSPGLGPLREEEMKPGAAPSPLQQASAPPLLSKKRLPAAPPRRHLSERASLEELSSGKADRGMAAEGDQLGTSRATSLSLPLQGTSDSPGDRPLRTTEQDQEAEAKASGPGSVQEPPKKTKQPPVPPPRKKRISRQLASALLSPFECPERSMEEVAPEKPPSGPPKEGPSPAPQVGTLSLHAQAGAHPQSSAEFTGSLASLSESLGVPTLATDQDSYSTSSTEEELEQFCSPSGKKKPSMILGKARHRLSLASFTNVFHAFLSNNRKLYKKVVELAQDKASYFGSLVQDYKVYSLEMMAHQASSTEMLQEIRTMMTQLKSYLLQSTELKALVDPTLHLEEELEAIVESALYKCVLKPLKEAINSCLHEIHSKDGSLQQLKENQLVVLATTTTDLGVTTSVPEVPMMEKILQKFSSMHKAYSPEKKIAILLKTCKLIYDSMALGNPGKPYGADDFLPVLMYVLARSNLTEMLLDVEYMMELMDPALQLGEGSYYLTTTYGALEHIKNYDKITVTRQLSVEVQDSIHRWERRRTLNKARASRSSVQDFICVSYLEPEQQSRTLASRADTPAQALCEQCAEKFEVAQPQDHRLFVLVDGRCFQLADEALPHRIKGYLLRSEPKRDFHFVYRPLDGGGGSGSPPCLVVREPNFL